MRDEKASTAGWAMLASSERNSTDGPGVMDIHPGSQQVHEAGRVRDAVAIDILAAEADRGPIVSPQTETRCSSGPCADADLFCQRILEGL